MAVNLSPIWGAGAQLLDNSGNVLTGGKIYTYLAGTTTPATTYTSSNGATANSNPIILNSAGRVPYEIWLTDSIEYKFVLKDSNDTLIGTWDNLVGINSNFISYYGQQEIQTATAGQTVFTLVDFEYEPNTGNLSVFVDGVNQYGPGAQYAYVETDATTITFVSGLHVGASVKFTTTKLENPGVADASQVSYTYPDANAVTESVETRLAQYVSVKDFGAVGDGVTDDTDAIQNALDIGGQIFFPTGTYKTNVLSVDIANTTLTGNGIGITILEFASVGINENAISVNADNVIIDGITFVGPTSAAFLAGENCIQTNGTFAAQRNNLTVKNCEIYNFGSYGINAEYTNNVNIYDNYIHDVGYGGVFFRSCITGWIQNNRISNITPGSSSNMYGITLSHTSTPAPTSKTSSTHFCYGINVTGNEIQNIAWEGIDAHGGYEIIVSENKVYNTKNGIAVASSSGDSLNYAGWQNIVSNNIVDARKKDGTTGDYMHLGYGININGYSDANVQNQDKVIVSGNIVFGKGIVNSTNGGSIQAEGVYNAIISNNCVDSWAGVGIILGSQTTAIVSENMFGDCYATDGSDSVKQCVRWRTGAGELLLTNNAHYSNGGQVARYGFYSAVTTVITNDGTNLALKTSGNSFNECSVAQMYWSGSAISTDVGTFYNHPQLTVSSTTIDVSKITSSTAYVYLTADAPVTVTGITGSSIAGQIITFVNNSANAITITRSYAYLSGSANQVLTNAHDSIVFISGPDNTSWTQISPTLANG